ncbi:MAG: 3-isopropylmalate dehydratase small subunit, partial [uncultured Nocardioides sp.]
GAVRQPHRRRCPAAAQQRRHRPDHPCGLPQAGDPHRLRGRPVRRLAQGPRLRHEPAGARRRLGARRRAGLRDRLVPGARGLGAHGLRVPGGHLQPLRRHLPRQLREGGAARRAGHAGHRRAALEARRGGPDDSGRRRPRGAVDPGGAAHRPVHHRRLHALPAAQRARRHRDHARQRRPHRGLRGHAAVVQAGHPL